MRRFVLAALAVTAGVVGCGDEEGSPVAPTPTPPAVTVTGVTLQGPASFIDGGQVLAVGESVTLEACASFSDETERCGVDATWTSASPGVATVEGGVVTGVAAGSARISAVYERHSAATTVTVEEPEPADEGPWTVSGTVTDADTGAGIRRAQVRVLGGEYAGKRATTNAQGRYLLPDVAGNMNVSVTADGYREHRTGFRVSMDLERDFSLEPKPAPEPEPEPEPAHPPVQRFQNCTVMRDAGWTRGVNRDGGTYRRSWDDAERRTYGLNTHSDRDNDGHACE